MLTCAGIPSGASSATESSRDGWGRRPADDSTARAADFNSRNSRADGGARRRHARHRFGDEAADVRDATAEIFSGLTDRDGGSEGSQFACFTGTNVKCDRLRITCFTSTTVQILTRQKLVEQARRDRPRTEGRGVFDVC